MILNGSDLINKNKNKVFKRLQDRKYPINVYTTLLIPNNVPEINIEQAIPRDDSLYCLPQDIERAVDLQLRTGSVSSTSTSSSAGGTQPQQRSGPPILPRAPIPRLLSCPSITSGTIPTPPPPRTFSQSSNGRRNKKDNFFTNLTKQTNKGGRYKTERTTSSSTDQEVAQPQDQNESGGSQEYADMDPLFRSEESGSLDEDSLLYEDLEANKDRSTLVRTADEVRVKTIALCWWSDKLNELTDTEDDRIELDPAFLGRKQDVVDITELLSEGTILTPSIGSVEVGILFGLIYDIPELVQVSVQWVKKHVKSSNVLELIKMYSRIMDHGKCPELINIIRKFIANSSAQEITTIISSLKDLNQDWVQIIGLNYVPVKIMSSLLKSKTAGDPNRMSRMFCTRIETELAKKKEDLDKSSLFIKLISPDFRKFSDELANSVTGMEEMRNIFKMEQQLTQKIMSTMMSGSFNSIVSSIKATLEKEDQDEEEHGLFSDRKWRRSTATELVLAFQQQSNNADQHSEGCLIDFVVAEIVLDWMKFNKFDMPIELCVNVMTAIIGRLDKLSKVFVEAMIAETHALLGPEAFSYISSNFSSRPTSYDHVTQRFVLPKNSMEMFLLGEYVTLKSECTLGTCSYIGTLSVITINLENTNVTPIVRVSPPSGILPNTEHMHYDFVHYCFTDNQHSQLHENVHLLSVMTKSYQEIRASLSALDGCAILFFAKNSDSFNV